MDELRTALLQETAKIPWRELQLWFAKGLVLRLASDEDLVEVAVLLATDKTAQVEKLLANGRIAKLEAEQAKTWYADDTIVWALVIKPWVLVQQAGPTS